MPTTSRVTTNDLPTSSDKQRTANYNNIKSVKVNVVKLFSVLKFLVLNGKMNACLRIIHGMQTCLALSERISINLKSSPVLKYRQAQ